MQRIVAVFAVATLALLMGCANRRGGKAAPVGSVGAGRAVYAARCAACHAGDGSGSQLGPSLRREHLRKTNDAIVQAIEYPAPPMPKLWPAQMTARDVADVAAYVEQL